MAEFETIRLDNGHDYTWRIGDVVVTTATSVSADSDDVHIALSLAIDGAESPPVLQEGRVTLDPWSVRWLPRAEPLPEPLQESHLTALVDKNRWELAGRGEILLQSRDRTLWKKANWAGYAPDVFVGYRALFPADFDLLVAVDDITYNIEDYHCLSPNCPCSIVSLRVERIEFVGRESTAVGVVSIDLGAPELGVPRRVVSGAKEAAEILEVAFLEPEILRRITARRAEARRIAPEVAAFLERRRRPEASRKARRGRNDPCICGSGKKYKRCCLDRDLQR